MKNKLKIYLDTSIINFLFADDAPEKRDVTIDFFENFIKKETYDVYISIFVVQEINATKDLIKRKKLLDVISDYQMKFIEPVEMDEIQNLSDKYIEESIIPEKNYFDAYHVAISTINEMNYLVSWNFRHLANIMKEKMIQSVNIKNGYFNELRIITPMELIDYGTKSI
ncbi:MAG: hypothetical protein HZB41_02675 [Ignavibacteriae bacterium]|nr:hypothetical protein [Ignavibacteriota bacterium]